MDPGARYKFTHSAAQVELYDMCLKVLFLEIQIENESLRAMGWEFMKMSSAVLICQVEFGMDGRRKYLSSYNVAADIPTHVKMQRLERIRQAQPSIRMAHIQKEHSCQY